MGSAGALFTTETRLPRGRCIEVVISWPAQRDGVTPLALVIRGLVVRSEETQTAVSIDHYEFRMLAASGLWETCGVEESQTA